MGTQPGTHSWYQFNFHMMQWVLEYGSGIWPRLSFSLPAGCREAANCRYCLYSQAKNQVFQGRLVEPIQVKLCRTDGHLGPLGCAKFHIYRCRGVGMRPPKYQKYPLFGKESPRRGDSLDWFSWLTPFTDLVLGTFIRLIILIYHYVSYVSVSHFMWFASQVTELLLRNRASVN